MEIETKPEEENTLSKNSPTLRAVIIIAVIFIVVFLYYVFYGNESDIKIEEQNNTEQEQVQDGTATLSVITDKNIYSVGETISIQVILDTDKDVSGVDIVLSYDDHIKILETTKPTEGISNQVAAAYLQTAQSGFTNFPFAKFGEDEDKKTLSFSGITAARQTITGRSVVADITAEAKIVGETTIDIVFEGINIPTDTNVAHDGRDILSSVDGATITILE